MAHSSSPCFNKFPIQKSDRKSLATMFWDKDGIFVIKYLPKSRTVNAEYYVFLLNKLREALKQNRKPWKAELWRPLSAEQCMQQHTQYMKLYGNYANLASKW